MRIVANELRKKNSPSYITDQLYQQALKEGRNAVIESIRTPGEIESLRSNGNFYLVAIDADPADLFERIRKRNSETDHVDYKTFLENEEQEMTSTDPNRQNLQRCREMADFIILNNGTVEELHNRVDKLFREITKQNNI